MNYKVSVYIPSHNYGHFLEEAIQSVISQSFQEWELILIDDASKDNSLQIMNKYKTLYPDQVRVFHNKIAQGLQKNNNLAINESRGKYIMRLDSDDYLDENALLVMSTYLDNNQDIALVYPNYVYVDESGRFLAIENRKKIGTETKLLDIPAHGACTMIRKRVLKSVGGYSDKYKMQDGYDIWLKILHRFPVGNVQTPLFYYRQHGSSLSRNEAKILETRRQIMKDRNHLNKGPVRLKNVCVIGAKNTYKHLPNIVFEKINHKNLIDYTIESVLETKDLFDKIIVSTDDQEVIEYCKNFPNVQGLLRPQHLSDERVDIRDVIKHSVEYLEHSEECFADCITYLNTHAPLRGSHHVEKAIDTLQLYNSDMVISVYEDFDLHYQHDLNGLKPINEISHRQLRIEREALYSFNSALKVIWRDSLNEDLSTLKVGHIVMRKEESPMIKTEFDLWMIKKIMEKNNFENKPIKLVK